MTHSSIHISPEARFCTIPLVLVRCDGSGVWRTKGGPVCDSDCHIVEFLTVGISFACLMLIGVEDDKTNNTDAFLKTFQACTDSASSTN